MRRMNIPPVRRCCKGSQPGRVAPAFYFFGDQKLSNKMFLTEYYALCDGGFSQDLLPETEKREMNEGNAY